METATTERTGTAYVPTLRNADYEDLLGVLQHNQAHKIDLIVPAEKLRFTEGMLVLEGQEMILEEDGFTDPNASYWPTQIFDDQIAERLDINTAYLRRLRHGRIVKGKLAYPARLDLWDANVNGLLRGRKPLFSRPPVQSEEPLVKRSGVPADPRSFFVRLIRPENGVGIARALLSNRFARLDNIDGLLAMLKGIQDAGVDPASLRIYGDLSETKMYVHVAAPEILTAAPELLAGYRSPFDTSAEANRRASRGISDAERLRLGQLWREQGRRGLGDQQTHGMFEPGTEPIVHAGFLLTNSEVGAGRWQITPEITVLRCSNGLTMTKDAFARTHVGAKQDDGHIAWSEDTQSKELAYVTAQTRDVVKAVLSADYLDAKVAELTEQSGKEISEPEKTIEVVGKKLAFSKEEAEGILRHFLIGGQITTGGVMNAVTSFAQTVADPDAAHDLGGRAVDAMHLAYQLA